MLLEIRRGQRAVGDAVARIERQLWSARRAIDENAHATYLVEFDRAALSARARRITNHEQLAQALVPFVLHARSVAAAPAVFGPRGGVTLRDMAERFKGGLSLNGSASLLPDLCASIGVAVPDLPCDPVEWARGAQGTVEVCAGALSLIGSDERDELSRLWREGMSIRDVLAQASSAEIVWQALYQYSATTTGEPYRHTGQRTLVEALRIAMRGWAAERPGAPVEEIAAHLISRVEGALEGDFEEIVRFEVVATATRAVCALACARRTDDGTLAFLRDSDPQTGRVIRSRPGYPGFEFFTLPILASRAEVANTLVRGISNSRGLNPIEAGIATLEVAVNQSIAHIERVGCMASAGQHDGQGMPFVDTVLRNVGLVLRSAGGELPDIGESAPRDHAGTWFADARPLKKVIDSAVNGFEDIMGAQISFDDDTHYRPTVRVPTILGSVGMPARISVPWREGSWSDRHTEPYEVFQRRGRRRYWFALGTGVTPTAVRAARYPFDSLVELQSRLVRTYSAVVRRAIGASQFANGSWRESALVYRSDLDMISVSFQENIDVARARAVTIRARGGLHGDVGVSVHAGLSRPRTDS